MKLEEKSIPGIWKYSATATYEPGDFVIHGENIYKVLEENEGEEPEKSDKYELYPGQMITSKEKYDEIIKNGGADDKYVSGQALNEILKATYFGLDSDGIITDTTDILPDGEIRTIDGDVLDSNDDSGVLDKLLVAEGYNNGMIKIGRETDQIKNLVGSAAYDEVQPGEGKWWIKVETDPDKPNHCRKCWECVRCGKGYIRKTKGTDDNPATLVIYPGEGDDFTTDRLGGEEHDDIKDASRFIEAVNICPYRALEYIDNKGDNIDVLQTELSNWKNARADSTRASKDIIVYGTEGNTLDPSTPYINIEREFTEDGTQDYIVSLYALVHHYYRNAKQSFKNELTQMINTSGIPDDTKEEWLGFLGSDYFFMYVQEGAQNGNIIWDTTSANINTEPKFSITSPQTIIETDNNRTTTGVGRKGKILSVITGMFSKYERPNTTGSGLEWRLFGQFKYDESFIDEHWMHHHPHLPNDNPLFILHNCILNSRSYARIHSETDTRISETWPNGEKKLNWLALQNFNSKPYAMCWEQSGGASGSFFGVSFLTTNNLGTLVETKTKNTKDNKVKKICEYIKMLKTLGGDIQLSNCNPSEDDLYGKREMPVPNYKWNDYDPFVNDLYDMYKCWWDLNNYNVQDYYKEGDEFPTLKDVWLNNSDRIHSLDRLSCNRLCVKLSSGIEEKANISNYSSEEQKTLLNEAYKNFLMDGIGKTEGEANEIINRGVYFYLLTGNEKDKTEELNKILHNLGAKSDYIFDIYPFYEPLDIITYHSDESFYDTNIIGIFSNDGLRYNGDNGKIIWYKYDSDGNVIESDEDIKVTGGAVFESVFEIITHIVTNDAEGGSFYFLYNKRVTEYKKYVYSLLSPYGFYRYLFGVDLSDMTPILTKLDIFNVQMRYGPIVPSIECRIAYNEWLYVIESLRGIPNSSDPTNKNVAKVCRIKLIPSPSNVKAYTSDERYKGDLDDKVIDEKDGYYEKHYYTGTTDPWVILKQYSYYDNDHTLKRIQEIIDPRLGGVFFRSSDDQSWVPLISSYEYNNWDLVRKLRRANEIVSGINSRNSVVYINQWKYDEYTNGKYNVSVRPKKLEIKYMYDSDQKDTVIMKLPDNTSTEPVLNENFKVYPSGTVECLNSSYKIVEIKPIYE